MSPLLHEKNDGIHFPKEGLEWFNWILLSPLDQALYQVFPYATGLSIAWAPWDEGLCPCVIICVLMGEMQAITWHLLLKDQPWGIVIWT